MSYGRSRRKTGCAGESPTSTLKEGELTLLGTCRWGLLVRLDPRYVPRALKENPLFREMQTQLSPDSARRALHYETGLQPAIAAVQTAFEVNPLVPSHLLASGGIPRIPAHLEFANSASRETARRKAVWYADLALGTWSKIPGALQWLEAQAAQARLLE